MVARISVPIYHDRWEVTISFPSHQVLFNISAKLKEQIVRRKRTVNTVLKNTIGRTTVLKNTVLKNTL